MNMLNAGTRAAMDLTACGFSAVEQRSEIAEQRWFQVEVTTSSGRCVAVNIQVEAEETTLAKVKSVVFTLTAQAPVRGSNEFENEPDIVVIPDKRPGCSFVWAVGSEEVRDVRVYVQASLHGKGYGFAVVTFIKALFFPFYTREPGSGKRKLHLPIGGARGVRRCSVLPVTPQARGFYLLQGFQQKPSHSKWYYESDELQSLLSCSSAENTSRLSSAADVPMIGDIDRDSISIASSEEDLTINKNS